jgi:hypothetical protein
LTSRKSLLVAAVAMLMSCGDSRERLDQEGDPCRTVFGFCIDDEQAMLCIDEVWTARDCDEVCAAEAPGVVSDGCEATNQIEGDCVCLPPPGGCTPGEAQCADDTQIDFCSDDWSWSSHLCTDVCAALPTHTISLGCDWDELTESASCSCTSAGTPCSDETPVCIDDSTLASCEAGVWSWINCADSCNEDAFSCVPALGGASCTCG